MVIMIMKIILSLGLTIPQIDKILAPYYKMSIEKTIEDTDKEIELIGLNITEDQRQKMIDINLKKLDNEVKQALQGVEMKLNTVVSARGSYPFVTFTFGDCSNDIEAKISETILQVRMEGHGDPGKKRVLIFPKLVFLYNPEIHEEGKPYEWLFNKAVECSSKNMYPDYLSPLLHKKEGKVISPMGCRAYLSDYRDPDTNELVYEGRGNIGVVSLNLPMIYMEALKTGKEFKDELYKYLQMIRELLLKRYQYLGKAKANSNPLMFMEGGAYKGNLKSEERISKILNSWTASFGITALNELSWLAIGKPTSEDNSFALGTMQYINDVVDRFKREDNKLYAIYGTPAESLAGVQAKQFRAKYGIIPNVSDKTYFTNSFHCHVSEEITPTEKQDKEEELFKTMMGGHIQYVRIGDTKNTEGLKAIIRRGMAKGFYQGVNFNACFCAECGEHGEDWGEICPHCGSDKIIETNRTCGYMGYSRILGDHTFNATKMDEIKDRVSM